MDTVSSLLERSKRFEEAHCTCKELLEARIKKIEMFVSKLLPIAITTILLLQVLGFMYFCACVDMLKNL